MLQPIHENELDTSEATVRGLLAVERPDWSRLPMTPVRSTGTDYAMWRLRTGAGSDLVVRLPRRAATEESTLKELRVLPAVGASPLARVVRTPTVHHVGSPTPAFPHAWIVLDWLDGTDAWTARTALAHELDGLARDLARAVSVLKALRGIPAPERKPGERGGPLEPIVQRLDAWLDDPRWNATAYLDVAAVRGRAADLVDRGRGSVTVAFAHGDLIPGNLLISRGQLSAILDWGGAGYADIALDLTPAWAVLDAESRATFRDRIDVDDATWSRAALFALEQAVGGVVYYTPRQHSLGDVMARTLDRVLNEC